MGDENIELKFSDNVWARIIQAFQEAILVGTDIGDILREIRVRPCADDPTTLVLTDRYVALVERSHEQLLERAEELKEQHERSTGETN